MSIVTFRIHTVIVDLFWDLFKLHVSKYFLSWWVAYIWGSNCPIISAKIEELGTAPIQDMANFYGGFPVVDPSWDPDSLDLTEFMAKIIRTMTSYSLFFSANINLGTADTSVYGIEVSICISSEISRSPPPEDRMHAEDGNECR